MSELLKIFNRKRRLISVFVFYTRVHSFILHNQLKLDSICMSTSPKHLHNIQRNM